MVAFRHTRSTVPKYSSGFEKLRNCRPNKHATGFVSSTLGMRQWRRPMELIGEGFFAQIVQKLLDDIIAGETDALSVFMEREKQRVLGDVPALVIPAAPGGLLTLAE